jgi:putative transcription factor
MRCEVCGRKIHTEPLTAIIEGAKLTVCVECSKHGKIILREEADLKPQMPSPTKSTAHLPVLKRKPPVAQVQLTQEIIQDYANKIRVAREELLLSHEDLGKKINEKASLLRHIETGKVEPDNQLAVKLEHTLHIKLLVPIADEKVTTVPRAANEGLTLGDLIEMGKNGGEASNPRKPS